MYFLIIFFSNSLQSLDSGILKHLFTYISINSLTKPTGTSIKCIHNTWFFKYQFIPAIKLYIIHNRQLHTLLCHGYNTCTKCLSEMFRIARFCSNFLKNFLGKDPQTPPLSRVFPRVCFDKFLHCYKCKTLLWFVCCCLFFFAKLNPLPLSCWKLKKKKRAPLFWNPGSATVNCKLCLPYSTDQWTFIVVVTAWTTDFHTGCTGLAHWLTDF